MASIDTDSGNLGAVIHSKRQTHLRWDHYWYFPVPEGLTGIELTCFLDQTSLLDGNIAMCRPGVDPETALDTSPGVVFYEIAANSEKYVLSFSFPEPGIYTFVVRGNYAYVTGEKFSKVEEYHAKGSVATEYMNAFITKMHFSDPPTSEHSQIANQLLAQFQQERNITGLPTLEDLEAGRAGKPSVSRLGQTRSGKSGGTQSSGRGRASKADSGRFSKTGKGESGGSAYSTDPKLVNARLLWERAHKTKIRGRNHFLLILVISIALVIAGVVFWAESTPPSLMMLLVGLWGLIVLYQAQFKYKVSGLWRFWVALVLLGGLLYLLDSSFFI